MEPESTPPAEAPITPAASPVMDVVAPPPEASQAPAGKSENDKKSHQKHEKVAPPKPTVPKQPGTGVGLAIFATIVIVLGLAALATYAYLKTR